MDNKCKYCDTPIYAREMCKKHAIRWLVHNDPHKVAKRGRKLLYPPGTKCLYCDRQATSRKMCDMHYRRWEKHGDPHKVLKREQRINRVEARNLRNSGMTYKAIGAVYGVSRQRIQQILQKPPCAGP